MKIFDWLILIGVMLLCACRENHVPQTPPPEKLRILSLVTAADHIIAELDAAEKIAAIDRHGRVLESMQRVPVLVSGSMVSREMLIRERINYAIVWYYQRELADFLKRQNIAVMTVDPITLENYPQLVNELGNLCGKSQKATELTEKFKSLQVANTVSNRKIPVYFELYAPWKSPAANSYISGIIARAGGTLAVESSHNNTVSPEAVCLAGVEVVFFVEGFGSIQEISSRAALSNSPAVKNKRIFAVPRKLVSEGVAPEEFIKFVNSNLKGI